MKNPFEHTSASWVRYDDYEWREKDGLLYLLPVAGVKAMPYDPMKDAEALVEKLEAQLAEIEAKLSTPEGAADTSLFSNHAFVKAQLTEAETEWEAAMMELEEN